MKIRLLLWGSAALVAVAAVLGAQATAPLNGEYVTRAADLKDDDARAHFDLAKWAFDSKLYTETALECDKLLALDSGDMRAKYLKKAAAFYKAGGGKDFIPPENGDDDDGGKKPEKKTPIVVNLKAEEVDAIFMDEGNSMAVFRRPVHPLLLRSCARAGCHGDAKINSEFYLKTQRKADNKTIAENFKAIERYINRGDLAESKILKIVLLPKDQHPGGPAFRNEREAGYQQLKSWVMSLKEGIW